jgi:hypothetical protein
MDRNVEMNRDVLERIDVVGNKDVVSIDLEDQGDVGFIGTQGSSEPATQANVSVGEGPMLKCIVAR